MKETFRANHLIKTGFILLFVFILWTVAIETVDEAPIGPQNSIVGFSGINKVFHEFTGLNRTVYKITDVLGLVPFAVCGLLGVLGLYQWIRRKSLLKVDADILACGVYYIIVILCYFLFEKLALNYRPEMVEGVMEASYPSSTTLLVASVMPSALLEINRRIPNGTLKTILKFTVALFTSFMVFARMFCGVHWLTDIIGGLLLGIGLFFILKGVIQNLDGKKAE